MKTNRRSEAARVSALTRDNTNRIAALPRGKKHWNYNPNPSILTMHRRIHRKHGKASNHPCFDCGKPAKDWSLSTTEYSDNVADYRPRCRSCHVKLDKNWLKKSNN